MLSETYQRRAGVLCRLLFFLVFLLRFSAAASDYLIDAWDSEDGLPNNFVTSIVQTPDGYLWIGTYNGLARFDGARFVTFKPKNTPELGHERIVKLFLDSQGTLWINTYDGSLTSLRNGVFTREWDGAQRGVSEAWLVASNKREIIFSFRSGLLIRRPQTQGGTNDWEILKPPGDPRGAIYCQDNTGTLWCSTLDGDLWRVTGGKFEMLSKESGLRGKIIQWLAPDPAGHVWVGTERELAMWDGNRFEKVAPSGEQELNVSSFSFTKDGGMLVAANGQLRKCVDGKWVAKFKPWPDLMQDQQFKTSLYQGRDGGLWRISSGLGIFHINPAGLLQQIDVADGLPGDHATCWLEDQEGNIWVGLGNGGIARLRKKRFETLAAPGRQGSPAISVCEDQSGALWVGTYGSGLDRWQNGRVTNYQDLAQNRGSLIFSIYPDESGELWLSAGMEDLFKFQDGQLKTSPIAVHAVKSIFVDRENRVWLGRKDGVDRWSDGVLREWNSHDGSIDGPVRTVVEDKQGTIWVGADNGNLYYLEGDELRIVPLPEYPGNQAIWSLLADADGSLWIGTADAGLLHFESGRFTRFTLKDGLPDDLICQILDDQRGNLWLGTHRGICRVSKASLHAFAAGDEPAISCSIYGRPDGLPTLQCADMYQPSAWRGKDGKLWFATAKGVVGVQPDEVEVNSRPPPVIIEEFLVGGKSQSMSEGSDAKAAALKIPPGKENFEFHYTALSLSDPDKVQFRYKLEGFDSDWVNSGGRRWTQYNYLKPGNYRFRVAASNNDGVWNETGASMNLEVLPHVWETWWFLASLGLAVTAGIASVVRYISRRGLRREMERLKHQRDLEQDRARIARDIHDHIGSGLTRINLLNELLLGDPPGRLPERVGQITNVTCELMGAMDEIVWAVNPKNDTLESLMSYLCDFADEYLRTAKIRLRINLPAPLPVWHLASEVRHNLFLAVKEILNNIVKHAQASEVYITLKMDCGLAALEIRDDGRGFRMGSPGLDPRTGLTPSGGNGLDNIQKRAASIGGRCVIESVLETGTRIELTIPGPKGEKQRKPRPMHSGAKMEESGDPMTECQSVYP